ncbi:hypothetical protein ILUMI_23216 [Ignelater luminosus]|uniref:Uncharacterized protein n=1 Tax=Ignelater luminosus TaxID=2038154 RepID=A0A8K0G254_IGNLU|nr:hypothetical protein ILUMI_23216 [Ignelater luminosus]
MRALREGLPKRVNWGDSSKCSWSRPQKENQEESSDGPPANLADPSSSLISSLGELQPSSSKAASSPSEASTEYLMCSKAVGSCVINGTPCKDALIKSVGVTDQTAKQNEAKNRNYVKRD